MILDRLKKILVRFRESKFGLLFIVNVFKIPDFLSDKRVNIINRIKVILVMIVMGVYFLSGIDIIPELILGVLGFADDGLLLIWGIGIISEEIEKYKKMIKEDDNSSIIKDVKYEVKD